MKDFLRRTWAEIDESALIHNFKIIKETAKSPVCVVVKANAYGHDVNVVAPLLQKAGANWFAVSNIDEAIELREIGITKPILILGYTPCEYAQELCKHNISQCVYSLDYAQELSQNAVKNNLTINIHLKLDTGMSRIGFDCRDDNLNGINDAIKSAKLDGFKLHGVFTHFAVSDRNELQEDGFTDCQYNRFTKAIDALKSSGLTPEICHCSNSAALCQDTDKHLDMCRAGIVLYGLTPSSDLKLPQNFMPVMSFKSVVSQVKQINVGDTVSYGRTFEAEKAMAVATVSCGYADGYPRLLSNKGYVLINGQKADIIGRVCMDQFCVDVTNVPNVKRGDEVLLWGNNLPVEELANIIGTINYELVCGVSSRVKRIIKKEQ
ncbi:MAG: alanine racemase [Clostridia bacterium]|nr:alanine racemase [Clostridia bacterium]